MSRQPLHPWAAKTEESSQAYSRTLATPEFVLAVLNDYAQGHNCPYLGVTISVEQGQTSTVTAQQLTSSLSTAFKATRWTYPIVAAQVKDNKELVYRVEKDDDVNNWVAQTVKRVALEGGWVAKHEQLSREAILPTNDGDCALLYLILSPEQASGDSITHFDLLLHVHHTLVDGAGLRSLMNEILTHLAGSTEQASQAWGNEVDRLTPAAVDVAIISDEVAASLTQIPKEIPLPPLAKGEGQRHGTGVVKHTFGSPDFLTNLKAAGRSHDVKLTAMVQAALLTILHKEVKPTEEEFATAISGFDLRAKNLAEPWSGRNQFVGAAVGLEMMKTPVSLFEDNTVPDEERFWKVAKKIQEDWAAVAARKDVAAAGELRRQATGFILQMAMAEVNKPSSKLGLSCNYVSDPAGSDQFDGIYKGEAMKLTLDNYQLVTDESTPKLSCRSHSWNDHLTIEISFSYKHHTKETVQDVLTKWALLLESLTVPTGPAVAQVGQSIDSSRDQAVAVPSA